MGGTILGMAKYLEGHSELGNNSCMVKFIAYPSNLTVVRMLDDETLFSVPWGNFNIASHTVMHKKGASLWGVAFARTIPGLDLTSAASAYHQGLDLRYMDEEIQRSQRLFFSTGSERKAEDLARKIMQHRDNYYRSLNRSSGPKQRE